MSEGTEETKEPDAEEVVEQSPDEQLATAICTKLIDDDLASDDKQDSITNKIATGQMMAEDWRVLASAAIKKEQGEAEEAKPESSAEEGGSES